MHATARPLVLSLCLLLLSACAALPPGKRDPRDPWERMNRATYRFNDTLDKAVLRPAARGYRKLTPQFLQTGVRNFMDNLNYTVVILNDLLQGQVKPFFSDTARLLVNTTIGIGGVLDPAAAAGLDKNDRDFGQTLGKWGLKKGPYVVLPLMGPSDVRDTFGWAVDDFSSPRQYIRNNAVSIGLWVVDKGDLRARLLDQDPVLDSAYDPYAFLRNAYLQHRDFKVNAGQSKSEEEQEEKLLEEAGEEQSAPAGAAPSAQPPRPAQPSPPPSPQPQSPPPH